MKKIIRYIVIAGAALSFQSCTDFLDVDKYFYDMLSVDSAFSKRVYVDGWLANNYDYLCKADLSEYCSRFQWSSDDLIHIDAKSLQQCNYSASNFPHDDFNNHLRRCYECVRKASTFIDKVVECKEMTMEEISDMQGQARFLRAFAYWSLVRTYGPVPLIPEHGLDVSLSYEELSLPRARFDEIIDFIDYDLSMAARNLPMTRTKTTSGGLPRGLLWHYGQGFCCLPPARCQMVMKTSITSKTLMVLYYTICNMTNQSGRAQLLLPKM